MCNYNVNEAPRPHIRFMYNTNTNNKQACTAIHVQHQQYTNMKSSTPPPLVRSPSSTIFPRRKAGEDVRTNATPIHITREVLTSFFGQPLKVAAKELGICITAMKTVCRKFGIERWPYRRMVRRHPKSSDDSEEGDEEPSKQESPRSAYPDCRKSASVGANVTVKAEVKGEEEADHLPPTTSHAFAELCTGTVVDSPLSNQSWAPCCSGGCSLCEGDSSSDDVIDRIGIMIANTDAWEPLAPAQPGLQFI